MNQMTKPSIEERVQRAAEAQLTERGYVSPLDVVRRLGWLDTNSHRYWQQGRVDCLEEVLQIGPAKRAAAMRVLHAWVTARGLQPVEAPHVARTRDHRELRFSGNGDPEVERAYRTDWFPADTGGARKVRRASAAPDLVVVSPVKSWTCGKCTAVDGDLLFMEDGAPLCMTCARLDHLVFLPAGDAGLTRRAHAASGLTAVVVRFSRTRKRYERQGLLVEPAALAAAQKP